MSSPKLADPIVFNYEQPNIKLSCNNLESSPTKQPITFHEALVNEDPLKVFGVTLDPTNTRDTATHSVKLNKAGLYHIHASVAKREGGSTVASLTIDVRFPGEANTFELMYGIQELADDFHTMQVAIPFRVLPNQLGTMIYLHFLSAGGSSNTKIRGWNQDTTAYEQGAQSGSWIEYTYLGP